MSRSGAPRSSRREDGSHVYTAGAPRDVRRRRRAVALAASALLAVLVVAGLWRLLPHREPEPAPTTSSCPAPPAGITVDVLNASTRAGLASVTADALRAHRFTVGQAVNAPAGTTLTAAAEIRHGRDAVPGARVLAAHVPGAVLVADDRTGTRVDLVVGADLTGVTAPATPAECR